MSGKPLISIITVNLNNLQGLKKTMDSVIGQTWQEFEFIVIDGGSKDGSKEFIQKNEDKIDHWISEPDKGIYNAMNIGIQKASGEYFLFLNSGDWLSTGSVLKCAAQELEGCDLLYGNMMKVFSNGKEVLDKGINGKVISLKTFIVGTMNHSSTFIKSNLFKEYGLYDEALRIVSDWKFFLLVAGLNNAEVKYLDLTISHFDMHGISNMELEKRIKERELVISEEIPKPIFEDYLNMRKLESLLEKNQRLKNFLITDQNKISRKLHSIIFRLFVEK